MAAQNQPPPAYQNPARTALATCNIASTDFGLDVEFFRPEAVWDDCSVVSGAATVFYPGNSSGSVEVCVDLPNGNATTAGLRLYNRGDFNNPSVVGGASRICQTINYSSTGGDDPGFITLSFYVYPIGVSPGNPIDEFVDGISASMTLPNGTGSCSINSGLGIGFEDRTQVRPTGPLSGTSEEVTYTIPNGANLSDLFDDTWLFKFHNGLILHESKVSISGSEFDNIPSVLGQGPSGNGVLVTGDTRNFRIYRVIIESDNAVTGGRGEVDFTRMETAVRINRGAEVQVLGTTMNFVENGLVSSEAGVIRFYENDVTATQFGFVRRGPGFFGRTYVRENTFLAQSLPGGVLEPAAMMFVGGDVNRFPIHNIDDNDIMLDGAVHGILSEALDGIKIRDNNFEWAPDEMFGTHAVTINGGQRPRITGNLIKGATGAPFTETDGVRLFMTDRPIVGCNAFENIETQLFVLGNNQRADIRGNNFINGGVGLKYGDPLITDSGTFTGPQIHRANRWIGPFQGDGACFHGSTFDDLIDSRYTVNTANGNLDFMPTSFCPGSAGWFFDDFGSSDPSYVCPTGVPPTPNGIQGGNVIKDIVDGTYQPTTTWQATQWLADYRVQRAFRNKEFTAQTYVGWQQYMGKGEVVTTSDYQEVENKLSISSAADLANYEMIDTLSNEAEILQRQYAIATVQALDTVALGAEMDVARTNLLLDLAEVEDSIAVYNASLIESMTQSHALAESLNNSLSSTLLPAKNQKFINALAIEIFTEGKEKAVVDEKTLKEIAVQCPLDGGEAVYQARALAENLNVQYNLADIDDCGESGSKRFTEDKKTTQIPSFRVYPNPAQQFISFTAGEYPVVRFDLLDINGRVVISKDYAIDPRSEDQISIVGIKAGAYLTKILLTDGNVTSELVIIK